MKDNFFGVVIILLWLAAFAGWIMNFAAIFSIHYWGGFEVMRVVGIFIPPIGALLGWF